MIPLQARAPGSDFYSNEQQIRLMPGKDVSLPKSYLRKDQIDNLKARRMIKVLHDSEELEQREEALNS
jgi:hypothetical protein